MIYYLPVGTISHLSITLIYRLPVGMSNYLPVGTISHLSVTLIYRLPVGMSNCLPVGTTSYLSVGVIAHSHPPRYKTKRVFIYTSFSTNIPIIKPMYDCI
jgi:hypothetical protein